MDKFPYAIPGLGVVNVDLYGICQSLYDEMIVSGECDRLQNLNHLGALELIYPGMKHSRWDYTVSSLYIATKLPAKYVDSRVTFAAGHQITYREAAQAIILLSSVGHVPGTFAVEQGIMRYLYERDSRNPLSALPLKGLTRPQQKAFEEDLLDLDYRGLNRALVLWKISRSPTSRYHVAPSLLQPLLLPFYVTSLRKANSSINWSLLDEIVLLATQIAYLNLDSTYLANRVFDVSRVISLLDRTTSSPMDVGTAIPLIQSFDRYVYSALYHSDESRKITAQVTEAVSKRLMAAKHPIPKLFRWTLEHSLSSVLDPSGVKVDLASTATRFSTLLPVTRPSAERLAGLSKALGTSSYASALWFAPISNFVSFESIERTDFWLDTLGPAVAVDRNAMKLLAWCHAQFDPRVVSPDESQYDVLLKQDLQVTYSTLVESVISHLWNVEAIRLTPWDRRITPSKLADLHLFSESRLDSPFFNSVMRGKRRSLNATLRQQYHEFRSLRRLWQALLKNRPSTRIRGRVYVAFPCSIKLIRDGIPLVEFDGGILEVFPRSGHATLHLVEAKTGHGSQYACNELQKKFQKIGSVTATTVLLAGGAAYASIKLV